MSLAVIGDGAAYEFRWRSWAMLRDVVVANLDETTLPAFCSLGDALVQGTLHVDAAALAADLARIREWLVGRPFDDLVLGSRTSAMLHFTNKVIERRALTPLEIDRIRPIADSQDLAEYFATMLDSFIACVRTRLPTARSRSSTAKPSRTPCRAAYFGNRPALLTWLP